MTKAEQILKAVREYYSEVLEDEFEDDAEDSETVLSFEIIVNSDSYTGYTIEDDKYIGVIPGLACGWQFEFIRNDGKIGYNSVAYYEGTPEEYCQMWLRYGEDALFEIERRNGYEPTGRVIFRGYGVEYYDTEYREWFIKDVQIPNIG